MDLTPLLSHFEHYLPLNEDEIGVLRERISEVAIKRRAMLLEEGEICKHYYFVVSGCFKLYKIDRKGQAHNLQFAVENEWITDIGSFHSELPSELNIGAIERSVVLRIAKPDLLYLYTHHPKFDRNFRVILEDQFVALQKRMLQNISNSALERYRSFLKDHPDLINRISNAQIAEYIGVTPEFLSKIRKKLVSR